MLTHTLCVNIMYSKGCTLCTVADKDIIDVYKFAGAYRGGGGGGGLTYP